MSADTTVFDAKKGDSVPMHKVPINEKDRKFLQSLYESDGPLSTTDIKSATGLSRKNIRYRYDKFGRDTYTNITNVSKADPEEEVLDDRFAGMNQAELTETGQKLIDQGLIGDPTEDYTDTKQDYDLDEYEQRIETLENKVNALTETIDTQKETIRKLNEKSTHNEEQVQSLSEWKTRINTFVIAVRKIFDHQDIQFTTYLKEAKDEIEERD